MFRATFSPIIRSTWLYLQLLAMSTDVAAGWCHGWDGELYLVGRRLQLYYDARTHERQVDTDIGVHSPGSINVCD